MVMQASETERDLSSMATSVASTMACLLRAVVHGPTPGVISAWKKSDVKGLRTGFGAAACFAVAMRLHA